MTTFNLQTQEGCVRYIVDRRYSCRRVIDILDSHARVVNPARREAAVLRASGNPLSLARAAVIDRRVKEASDAATELREWLQTTGAELFDVACHIDAHVPRSVLFDIINANTADRDRAAAGDGFVEIVFAHCLEDSAESRRSDTASGPLFRAFQAHFHHQLVHNAEFNRAASDLLFGQGGMFEWVPKAQEQPDGTWKRLPPPLRLVQTEAPNAEAN